MCKYATSFETFAPISCCCCSSAQMCINTHLDLYNTYFITHICSAWERGFKLYIFGEVSDDGSGKIASSFGSSEGFRCTPRLSLKLSTAGMCFALLLHHWTNDEIIFLPFHINVIVVVAKSRIRNLKDESSNPTPCVSLEFQRHHLEHLHDYHNDDHHINFQPDMMCYSTL